MKVRNKKTGEIKDCVIIPIDTNGFPNEYEIIENSNSLIEFNNSWEDYQEEEYYYAITSIKCDGGITKMKNKHNDMTAYDKSIGNYFETKEEAEQAVEKLKAWKRLKDKGFKFEWWISKPEGNEIVFYLDDFEWSGQVKDDLDLLFGGKE